MVNLPKGTVDMQDRDGRARMWEGSPTGGTRIRHCLVVTCSHCAGSSVTSGLGAGLI